MQNKNISIDEVKQELALEALEKENLSLKSKIEALRSNNNSYLYSALVKVQAELPIIAKSSVIYGRQKYASLADITRVSRPILVKHGLAVTQTFLGDILITRLCHVSGQFIESSFKLPIPESVGEKQNIIQEIGKQVTFFRRYCFSAIIGIVTDEDTDGN